MKQIFRNVLCFSVSALSLCSMSASAQTVDAQSIENLLELEIEELSVLSLSSFFETSTNRANGRNAVIDLVDQERYGTARTLRDHIDTAVPGMITSRHERHNALIGVRGFLIDNNAKTPVMLDGQLLSNRNHFGYTSGLESPLLGDMARAEVSLSSNGTVLGGGAINGYINLKPKNGKDHVGTFVNYEHGIQDELNAAEVGHGLQYGEGRDLYVYAGVVGANGYTPDTSWNQPLTTGYDLSRGSVGGFGETGFRFSSYWNHDNFSLNTFVDKIAPQNATARDDNDTRGQYMHHTMLGVRPTYTYQVTGCETIEFLGSVLLQDFGWRDRPDFAAQELSYDKGGSEAHFEGKVIYRNQLDDTHSFAVGSSIGRRLFNDRERYFGNSATETGLESINFDWHELALFAEDKIQVTDDFTLTLGARFEGVSFGQADGTSFKRQSNLSPKVAFSYEHDEDTFIKGSYQSGFRYPDAFYYDWKPRWEAVAAGAGAASDLKPETVETYEVNFIKELEDDDLKLELSAFHSIYHDALGFRFFEYGDGFIDPATWIAVKESDGAVYDIATNTFNTAGGPEAFYGSHINARNKIKTFGLELSADWDYDDDLSFAASYGFARILHPIGPNGSAYPEHILKANMRKEFLDDRLVLHMNGVFHPAIGDQNQTSAKIYDDPRFLIDTALTYNWTENLRMKIIGQNLLGEQTPSASNLSSDPSRGVLGEDERLFYLSMGYKF